MNRCLSYNVFRKATGEEMTLQQFKIEALALDTNERAELAHTLIQSLDQPAAPGYEDELDQEIDRRVLEINEGVAIGRPAFDALEDVRKRLG
jgi:putative addiction module component (TIGR02574 family)